MDLLNGLNPKQKEAVETTEGSVMVIAGAGSGKTKVLTHRIAYIINELGIDPFNILAVTFTNKAATEMKHRVSNLLNINTKNMWISTFHSFCSRILRKEIHHLGYSTNFSIIDSDDALKIIKKLVKDTDYLDFTAKELRDIISDYKNDVVRRLPDSLLTNFHKMYELYNQYLFENNLLDFDDLIVKTLFLFKTNIDILNKYSSTFNYVMVDEFQDTNKTQYELVTLLSSIHNNIFIVGDQDQSIYSFRGALVTNIDQFRKDYSEVKVILLEQNYRSTQVILDAANKIISTNKNRIEKNLFSNKADGLPIMNKNFDTSYGEINFISREIMSLTISKYQYKDIAVLYRANSLSRGIEEELIKQNIPYVIYGGLSYFSRMEVKDIIAYLRLICNCNDNFSLRRIINVPRRKVGDASLQLLEEEAIKQSTSIFDVLDKTTLAKSVSINLCELKDTIINLANSIEEVPLNEFVKKVIKELKYDKMLKDADEEDRLDNINELASVLLDASEFYEGTNKEKLEAFLMDLALRTDSDDDKNDDNKVRLMSFHQAKGLEFKAVFMPAMEMDIFPSSRIITNQELEEEYRICYVGITRAMERLYLTNCNVRRLYGKDSYMQRSIFIEKLFNDGARKSSVTKTIPTRTTPTINKVVYNPTSNYKIGDKVIHKAWGVGVVVMVTNDNLDVAFDVTIGKKTLKDGHPSFSKMEE